MIKKYLILILLFILFFCFLKTEVLALKIIYPKNSLSSEVPEIIRPQVYENADSVPLSQKITDKNYKDNPDTAENPINSGDKSIGKNIFLHRPMTFLIFVALGMILIFIFKKWYNKYIKKTRNN